MRLEAIINHMRIYNLIDLHITIFTKLYLICSVRKDDVGVSRNFGGINCCGHFLEQLLLIREGIGYGIFWETFCLVTEKGLVYKLVENIRQHVLLISL